MFIDKKSTIIIHLHILKKVQLYYAFGMKIIVSVLRNDSVDSEGDLLHG